jgi:hypothetical protein
MPEPRFESKSLLDPSPFKRVILLLVVPLIVLGFFGSTVSPSSDDAIAFLRLTRDYWQIWLMNPDGTNSRQLTSSPSDKESPSWCPGNEVIHYYTSFGVAMLVDTKTGLEQMMDPLAPPIPPPLGPNGEVLEFPDDLRKTLRDTGHKELAGLTCGDPDDEVGETIELTVSDSLPVEKALAVLRRPEADAGRLFEVKFVDLGNALDYGRFASDGKAAKTDKVLSANGTLAFVSASEGKSELWIRRGEQDVEQLTYLGANTAHPSWSPDGQWLTFESDFQGTPQIFRVALSRRGTLERLSDGKTPSRHPVFRPSTRTP